MPLQSSPTDRESEEGVAVAFEGREDAHELAAVYFCFQHKDQAPAVKPQNRRWTKINQVQIRGRTSIDTLAERLNLHSIEDNQVEETPTNGKQKKHGKRPARIDTVPLKTQDTVEGPLLTNNSGQHGAPNYGSRMYLPKERSSFWSICCFSMPEDELSTMHYEPGQIVRIPVGSTRPSKRTNESKTSKLPSAVQTPTTPSPRKPQMAYESLPSTPQRMSDQLKPNVPSSPSRHTLRPQVLYTSPSQTQTFLSYIPSSLSPSITSKLLAELAKPISKHDEAGYIYIFSLSAAIEAEAAAVPSPPGGKILIKIGRATNVTRRLYEWTRQCEKNVSLLRYYPYIPGYVPFSDDSIPAASRAASVSAPMPAGAPTKVPFAHRVERLIHVELSDLRVRRHCMVCQGEHREWFEVERSMEAVKAVDEVCRRWVDWAVKTAE